MTLYCKRPDGSYNGLLLMASLTGLSTEEVAWTWKRIQQLVQERCMSKEAVLLQVKEEAKAQPWKK